MVLIELPLSWVRDIRRLTPLNILATILIAYGLASCLVISLFGSIPVDEIDTGTNTTGGIGKGNGTEPDIRSFLPVKKERKREERRR
mmetsp:Transcript_39320/g.80216  ORF Transcript_39320/g.80216 Transcript_39320/m.80216 type:complete len:87 (+) Transcript_39320:354-614(+)